MNNAEFNSKVLSRKERMYRLAKSMLGDVADAQDTVQDVLERLWTRREDLGAYGNLDAFILTSVKNTCLDRLRSRRTREEKKDIIAASHQTASDPRRMQDITDMTALAGQLISGLPEKQRMVIHLRDVEQMDMEEISEVTGIEEDVLRVYLSRARKTVREKLIKMIDYGIRQ